MIGSGFGNGLSLWEAARRGVSFGKLAAVALVCVLACAVAQARVHRSQAWAETQFNKAESQRQTLEVRAEQSRTRREYQTAIDSYRRVVLEAPASSKAEGSAFLVAQLTAEKGRHFNDDMALYAAVREYKFLRREYPGSRHRIEALLAIGEIYKNDLGHDDEARVAFEELIHRYPHSDLAKEARAELDGGSLQQASATNSGPKNANPNSNSKDGADSDEQADNSSGKTSKTEATSAQAVAVPALRAEQDSPQSNDGKSVRVKDVQYLSTPEYTRISIELDQDVQYDAQRIDNPDRIFFDLKNAKLASHLAGQTFDVDDGVVKKVRVAQYRPGRARVVVETENRANYTASLTLNPPRLVIDVHGDESALASAAKIDKGIATLTARTSESVAGKTAPKVVTAADKASESIENPAGPSAIGPKNPKKVIVEADDDDSAADSAPSSAAKATVASAKSADPIPSSPSTRPRKLRPGSSRSMRESQPTSDGDRSLIRALGLKIGKIVIDPGHGGHDTGTIGSNGMLEKDLVLDVSKRLGKLLESRLGAEVVFTRRDDTFIPLETRTSIANQEQADLFVSVHANSSQDQDARGVETYYLNFTSSPEALEVAARENAASDKSIHELQDLVKKIALKEKIEESREFASDVQQSLHTGLAAKSSGVRDRGVKKAPFVVLIGANMPSILAEISFLSNPGDEKRLRTPDYRQRIAESLYRGVSRYVNGLGGVKVASQIEKSPAN